jgi:hypothetical protein
MPTNATKAARISLSSDAKYNAPKPKIRIVTMPVNERGLCEWPTIVYFWLCSGGWLGELLNIL